MNHKDANKWFYIIKLLYRIFFPTRKKVLDNADN